ncbi:hypothetical protein VCUG_00849 [Vavraia culicis subsp. floridensis]|uniref:Matrin-type domain-containing protein n=1 Tax=Vavraia culicis (isolate floridensis) TaxID=948595 RepID=L2GWH0_VAVCU|nr:uncharacterized protein VCUG_00849 [Vavraia culicis subsp. floridensis]ELA47648.1 hypothetical protein VCUG_00849 [Vavraia culicis subsp. floridensis]
MHCSFFSYLILIRKLEFQIQSIDEIRRCKDNSPKIVLLNKYLLRHRQRKVKKIREKIQKHFDELKERDEDPETVLDHFNEDFKSVEDGVVRSTLRRRLLPRIEALFSAQENYGTCLDLRFLEAYYAVSYEEVLQKVTNFALEIENEFEHLFALLHLRHYLKDFVYKSKPVIRHKKISRLLSCAESEHKVWNTFENKVYCMFCMVDIAKSVFEYHAAGKKHNKAKIAFLKNMEATDNDRDYKVTKCINVYLKLRCEYVRVTSTYVNRLEAQVKLLLTFLETELKLAVSVQGTESVMNIEKEKKIYNTRIYRDETGNPIPRWLYKQRGLNVEYICEICKNCVYKGRKEFERHFNGDKHKHFLVELGIASDFEKYHGISQIKNALKLRDRWK